MVVPLMTSWILYVDLLGQGLGPLDPLVQNQVPCIFDVVCVSKLIYDIYIYIYIYYIKLNNGFGWVAISAGRGRPPVLAACSMHHRPIRVSSKKQNAQDGFSQVIQRDLFWLPPDHSRRLRFFRCSSSSRLPSALTRLHPGFG